MYSAKRQVFDNVIADARSEVQRMRDATQNAASDLIVSMRVNQFRWLCEMIDVLTELSATIDPDSFAMDNSWVPTSYLQELQSRIAELEAELSAARPIADAGVRSLRG